MSNNTHNHNTKVKTTAGRLEYRQFILLDDGSEIRVRYNQNPELYAGTDTPVYSYQAKEGSGENAKEVTRYAVPFELAKRASRTTVKESVKNMLAQGLTADEIVAKLAN